MKTNKILISKKILIATIIVLGLSIFEISEKYRFSNLLDASKPQPMIAGEETQNLPSESVSIPGVGTISEASSGSQSGQSGNDHISFSDLFKIRGNSIRSGDLIIQKDGSFYLAQGVVANGNIQRYAIKNFDISTSAVNSRTIKDHSIRSVDMGDASVTARTIKDHSVGSIDLGSNISIKYLRVENGLTIDASNLIANLNADFFDGHDSSYFQTALTNPVTGSGGMNYLAKFSGSSSISNSLIYDDGVNVGIGMTNPSEKLDLNGALHIESSVPNSPSMTLYNNAGILTWNGVALGTSGASVSGTAGYLGLFTGPAAIGNSSIYNSAGNVGIGTTTPATALDVNGVITATGGNSTNWNSAYAHSQATSNVHGLTFTSEGSGGGLDADTIDGHDTSYFQTALTNPVTGTGTSGYLPRLTGASTIGNSVIYDNGASIGIGTTNPGAKLDVNGSAFLRNTAWQLLLVDTDGTNDTTHGGTLFSSNNGLFTLQGADQSGVGSDPRFAIDQVTGNIGIGTTNPLTKLGIYSTTASQLRLGYDSSVYADFSVSSVGDLTISPNTIGAKTIIGVGDTSVYIDGSGNVGIGTTSPLAQLHTTGTVRFANFGAGTLSTDANGNLTVSSDERLKDVTGSFDRGLEALMNINPISYHWNAKSGLDTKDEYTGFSAQNVQASIPEAVGLDNRGYLTLSDRPVLAAVVNAVKTEENQINTQIAINGAQDLSISGISLKIDSSISSFNDLKSSMNERLKTIDNTLASHDSRIKGLEDSQSIISAISDSMNEQQTDNSQQGIEIASLDQKTLSLGNNYNALNGRLSDLSQRATIGMLIGRTQVESVDFFDFSKDSKEISSDLSDVVMEDSVFRGTYDNPGNFQQIAINLETGNDLSSYQVNNGYLSFDVYMEDADATNDFTTEVGNKMDEKEIEWSKIYHPYFVDGWNHVELPIADGTKTGQIDWSNLSYFRIYFKFASQNSIAVKNIKIEAEKIYKPTDEDMLTFNGVNFNLADSSDQEAALKAVAAKLENSSMSSTQDGTLEGRLSVLEQEVGNLQSVSQSFIDFAKVLDPKTFVFKDSVTGNLDLGEGILTVQKVNILETLKVNKLEAEDASAKNMTTGNLETDVLQVGGSSSGKAVIQSGNTEVKINTPEVSKDSKIYITPEGSSFGKEIYYDNVSDGESFKVKFDGDSIDKDIHFNWLIIK